MEVLKASSQGYASFLVAIFVILLSSMVWWKATNNNGGKSLETHKVDQNESKTQHYPCPDCSETFQSDSQLTSHYAFAHGMGVISASSTTSKVDSNLDSATPTSPETSCNIQMKLINQIMSPNKREMDSCKALNQNTDVLSNPVSNNMDEIPNTVGPSPGVHHRHNAVHKHLARNGEHSHFTDSESSGSDTEDETMLSEASVEVTSTHTEQVVMFWSNHDESAVSISNSVETTSTMFMVENEEEDITDRSGVFTSDSPSSLPYENESEDNLKVPVEESDSLKVSIAESAVISIDKDSKVGLEWDTDSLSEIGIPADKVSGVLELCMCVGARQGISEPLIDPITLLRFLNSREGDLADALTMYRETVAWRKSFGLVNILKTFGDISLYDSEGTGNLAESGSSWEYSFNRKPTTTTAEMISKISFFHTLQQTCDDEAPIAVWQLGSIDFAGIVREGLEDQLRGAFLSHLEEVLQLGRAASSRQKKMVRCRVVIDGRGLGLWMLPYLSVLKLITGLGKAYFPETTASATIVNAPWVFARLYGAISPMLTPVMRAKVCILDGNFETGLVAHSGINISHLPQFLGGNLPDALCPAPKPVPKGAGAMVDRII